MGWKAEYDKLRADLAAANAALAKEREECAKIAATAADNPLFDIEEGFVRRVGSWIANAIRARTQPEAGK